MNNRITTTPFFDSRFKKFSKKFPTLNEELSDLEIKLLNNPKSGIQIGFNIYKIRLASKDKAKGKSGGFRIITYLIEENNSSFEIFLITIYDKSEESSIKKQTLQKIIKDIFE